jgi:hypothetical protein
MVKKVLTILAITRLAEFHRTPTPEQREKLVAKLEYFHKRHEDHWDSFN